MEWFVLALEILALILAATSMQMAPLGYAYRVRRLRRAIGVLKPRAAHDQAKARSPERKA